MKIRDIYTGQIATVYGTHSRPWGETLDVIYDDNQVEVRDLPRNTCEEVD